MQLKKICLKTQLQTRLQPRLPKLIVENHAEVTKNNQQNPTFLLIHPYYVLLTCELVSFVIGSYQPSTSMLYY